MKFSIIIPAYNSAAYIRKALDSIASQTFKDYELIVVCDSCEDDTEEIAKSYGAITKCVQFHRDGLTRNVGLDMARGEWILFMDDDDWWLHEYVLQVLSDLIDKYPDKNIFCFSFIFRTIGYAEPQGNRGYNWVAVWNKCWKRSIIGNTRFSGEWSISDLSFHNEMFQKRKVEVKNVDKLLYYYNYLREGSITETDQKKEA